MRSRGRPTRAPLFSGTLAAALLLIATIGLFSAAVTHAQEPDGGSGGGDTRGLDTELELPPPPLSDWPANPEGDCVPDVTTNGGSMIFSNGSNSSVCRYWAVCHPIYEAQWTERERRWCGIRDRAAEYKACWNYPRANDTPECQAVSERNRSSCIDAVPSDEDEEQVWLCDQGMWAFRTDWDDAWTRNECDVIISNPGLEEDRPEAQVEVCRRFGSFWYADNCTAAQQEPLDLCRAWESSPLSFDGDCSPNPSTPRAARRCRDANEERWRELGCTTTRDAALEQDDFCRRYGWQRFEDFCRVEAQSEPTHRPPYRTPDGEERPEGIDAFCEEFPSSALGFLNPPAGIPGFRGEADPEDEAAEEGEGGAPDIFSSLGAASPLCAYAERLLPQGRVACDNTGSIAHVYPIGNYGLDYQGEDNKLVDLDVGRIASSVIQSGAGFFWMGMVWVLKGILLLLELAFTTPVVGGCEPGEDARSTAACSDSMPEVSEALLNLHQNVLGTPWTMAALALAGFCAMWNGLVRLRVSETIMGLATTLLLMAVALAIIHNPVGTVGWVARTANDASLSLLNAAGRSGADNPTGSFAAAHQGLFDTLVTRPWCALQFGDVAWCLSDGRTEAYEYRPGRGVEPGRRPPNTTALSVADVWLAFPAGELERETLYKLIKGEEPDNSFGAKFWDWFDESQRTVNTLGFVGCTEWSPFGSEEPCPNEIGSQRDRLVALADNMGPMMSSAGADKVALQEEQGTGQRVALLGIVGFTMVGAGSVLGWLAVRLFVASVLLLGGLAVSPFALFLASAGEPGRMAAVNYLLGLLAAGLAKLWASAVLFIVLLVAGLLASLAIGWFALWLLQAAFWWGIFFNRGRLRAIANFDFAGAGRRGGAGGGEGWGGLRSLLTGYFAYKAFRDIGSDVVGKPVGAAYRAVRGRAAVRAASLDQAFKDRVGRDARTRALGAMRRRHNIERGRADGLVAQKKGIEAGRATIANNRGNLRSNREQLKGSLSALDRRGREVGNHLQSIGAERGALEDKLRPPRELQDRAGRLAREHGDADASHKSLLRDQEGRQQTRDGLARQQQIALADRDTYHQQAVANGWDPADDDTRGPANARLVEGMERAQARADELGNQMTAIDQEIADHQPALLDAANERNDRWDQLVDARNEISQYEDPATHGEPYAGAADDRARLDQLRAEEASLRDEQTWIASEQELLSAEDDFARDQDDRLRMQDEDLREQLDANEERFGWAERFVQGDQGGPDTYSDRDVDSWLHSRAHAWESGANPADPENLLYAGIDPEQYDAGSPAEQAHYRAQSEETMRRDAELARASERESFSPAEREGQRIAREHDPTFREEAEQASDELRARIHNQEQNRRAQRRPPR